MRSLDLLAPAPSLWVKVKGDLWEDKTARVEAVVSGGRRGERE